MIPGFLNNYFKELIIKTAIKHRETCKHWIDYEIYDRLTKKLKEKYLNQFAIPEFIYSKLSTEKEYKKRVSCKANHTDPIYLCRCDCSEFYPKTLEEILPDADHLNDSCVE